MASKNTKPLKA